MEVAFLVLFAPRGQLARPGGTRRILHHPRHPDPPPARRARRVHRRLAARLVRDAARAGPPDRLPRLAQPPPPLPRRRRLCRVRDMGHALCQHDQHPPRREPRLPPRHDGHVAVCPDRRDGAVVLGRRLGAGVCALARAPRRVLSRADVRADALLGVVQAAQFSRLVHHRHRPICTAAGGRRRDGRAVSVLPPPRPVAGLVVEARAVCRRARDGCLRHALPRPRRHVVPDARGDGPGRAVAQRRPGHEARRRHLRHVWRARAVLLFRRAARRPRAAVHPRQGAAHRRRERRVRQGRAAARQERRDASDAARPAGARPPRADVPVAVPAVVPLAARDAACPAHPRGGARRRGPPRRGAAVPEPLRRGVGAAGAAARPVGGVARDVERLRDTLPGVAIGARDGVMLFLVREIDAGHPAAWDRPDADRAQLRSVDSVEHYTSRGYRMAETRFFSATLADRFAVSKAEMDVFLSACKTYAKRGTRPVVQPTGAYLGLFGVRPTHNLDVLVYNFARHQIPAYRLPDVAYPLAPAVKAYVRELAHAPMDEVLARCRQGGDEVVVDFLAALCAAMEALTTALRCWPTLPHLATLSPEILDIPADGDGSGAQMVVLEVVLPAPDGRLTPVQSRASGVQAPDVSGRDAGDKPPAPFVYTPFSLFAKSQDMLLRARACADFERSARGDLGRVYPLVPVDVAGERGENPFGGGGRSGERSEPRDVAEKLETLEKLENGSEEGEGDGRGDGLGAYANVRSRTDGWFMRSMRDLERSDRTGLLDGVEWQERGRR
ncbi:hypothetical protein L204_101100 [Cryptococcus depauperatus]